MNRTFGRFMFLRNPDNSVSNYPIIITGRKLFSTAITTVDDTTDKQKGTNQKILKVAIVGVPNSGKSTFINQIVGRNIFAISRKVHTTRCCARAIINIDDTQLVFLDTPGVVSAKEGLKHHLERTCIVDSENAIQEADVVGILHDVSNKYTKFKLDPKILRLLYLYSQKHTFLILNKIDAMTSRRELLDCVRILTKQNEKFESKPAPMSPQDFSESCLLEMMNDEVGWSHFKDVFMVSGLTGNGVGDVQMYLKNLAQPGKWIFPNKQITDQKEVKVIEDTVFSKLLDNIPYHIPYTLQIQLNYFDVAEDGSVTASINIAGNARSRKYLMGEKGSTIRRIALQVEQSLRQYYLNDVRVKLVFKETSASTKSTMKSLSEDEKEKLLKLS